MSWLTRQLAAMRRDRPAARALTVSGRALTYGELATAVWQVAARLAQAGVAPGDRVVVQRPNTLDHVLVILALAWRGAVLVPAHPRASAQELGWQLADVRARWLIADPAALPLGFTPAVPILPPFPLEVPADSGNAVEVPADSGNESGEEALATILYTSGTTGRPKPVPLTWAHHLASLNASADRLGVLVGDDWYNPLPLCHVGGLAVAYRCLAAGTAMTLSEGFDAAEAAALLSGGRVTLASMVPTMVRRLLREPGFRPAPALRTVLLGGGPVAGETLRQALAIGLPLVTTYGLTEAASQVATSTVEDTRAFPESAGTSVRGGEVEVRGVGEVWVRGPMVMTGYLDRPEENARRFDGEGWFDTGDFGRLDANGRLYIEARREDLILTGGENVYPAEVEAVVLRLPGVEEVAVIGLPDAEWGQQVAAVVATAPGRTAPSAEELDRHCRTHLAAFKVPRRWVFLSPLPKTASGKVQRAVLRQQLAG